MEKLRARSEMDVTDPMNELPTTKYSQHVLKAIIGE